MGPERGRGRRKVWQGGRRQGNTRGRGAGRTQGVGKGARETITARREGRLSADRGDNLVWVGRRRGDMEPGV